MRRALAVFALTTAPFMSLNPALAASDGGVGSTSAGSLDITLTIPMLVRISGFTDIDLGTFDGTAPMSGQDGLCVWSTTGGYRLGASDGTSDGSFTLTGQTGSDSLVYGVEWEDEAGTRVALSEDLWAGDVSTPLTTNASSASCEGSTNSNVYITISEAAIGGVGADTYTGTLTLTVEPL
jgi:hypothetical protein